MKYLLSLLLLLTLSGEAMSQAVTSNVLLRVKKLIAGPAAGTAFTMEVDGRQYVITAKHVIATLQGDKATVQLCSDQIKCQDVVVSILRCADPIDIAVLIPEVQQSPAFPLAPELKGAFVGQEMFFVGFPYGDYSLTTKAGDEAIGFVRRATFSAQEKGSNFVRLYLDGRNNSGFSGSPVVYVDYNDPKHEFKIAGVVSGFRTEFPEVVRVEPVNPVQITPNDIAQNRIVNLPDGTRGRLVGTGTYIAENTGIVIAYAIDDAVDLIRKAGVKGPVVK